MTSARPIKYLKAAARWDRRCCCPDERFSRQASSARHPGLRYRRLSSSRRHREIGRASCRERGCRYVYISVVAESLTQNNITEIIDVQIVSDIESTTVRTKHSK